MSVHTTIVLDVNTGTLRQPQYTVVLFDCDCHLLYEVVLLLMKAIKCSESIAFNYADIAQKFGEVVVFTGSHEDCERVAIILSSTGLNVSITSN